MTVTIWHKDTISTAHFFFPYMHLLSLYLFELSALPIKHFLNENEYFTIIMLLPYLHTAAGD